MVLPNAPGRHSSIILFMDAFGPRAYLDEMATTLSDQGYLVLVPNLFYRIKRAPLLDIPFPITKEAMPAAFAVIRPLLMAYESTQGVRDSTDFVEFLRKQPTFNGKIGFVGYCMGGAVALRAAANLGEQVSAVATFHAGRLVTDAADSPHLLFGSVKAEIYIAHADNDTSMPADQIGVVKKALEESGTKNEAETYTGAEHGFTMADLPAYNAEAFSRHWQKLSLLFARNLMA